MKKGRDLENDPPRIIHLKPEGSRVKATRNAVISSQVKVSTKNRTDGFFTSDMVLDFNSTATKANKAAKFANDYALKTQKNGMSTVPARHFGLLLEALVEPELQTNFIALQELASDHERLLEVIGPEFELHLVPNFGLSEMANSIALIAEQLARSEALENRERTADFISAPANLNAWTKQSNSPAILGHIRALVGDSERALRKGKADKTIVLLKNFAIKNGDNGTVIALSCSVNIWLPEGAPVISIHSGGFPR
jgi:hypothetical protein